MRQLFWYLPLFFANWWQGHINWKTPYSVSCGPRWIVLRPKVVGFAKLLWLIRYQPQAQMDYAFKRRRH